MTYKIPEQPENSFRITLELEVAEPRLDTVLLDALQNQTENEEMKKMSKRLMKKLFTEKKILIKGQSARPKSTVNSGITYIDILN